MLQQVGKIKLIVAIAMACAVLVFASCAGAQQLYVGSQYTSDVYRYDVNGAPAPAPGQSGALFANMGSTWNGYGVAPSSDGYVYVARNDGGNVVRYNMATGLKDTSWNVQIVPPGSASQNPMDLKIAPNGSLYATSYGGSANIYKIDIASKTFSTVLSGASLPYCMDIDAQGRGYLTNYTGGRVTRYNEVAGSWTLDTTFDLSMPNDERSYGVAVDSLGRVYATNYVGNVYRFDSTGSQDMTWEISDPNLYPGISTMIAIGPGDNPYVSNGWYVMKLDANDQAVQTVFVDRIAGVNYDYLRWDMTPVPEPGSLLALGAGFVSCLGLIRRRR